MKPFNILLATGNNIPEAVKALSTELDREFSDKACQLQQIFLLPQMVVQSQIAANTAGQPQYQTLIHLVAVITEEPELDALQRNFKPVFDFMNNNREQFIPILQNWLAMMAPDSASGMPGI